MLQRSNWLGAPGELRAEERQLATDKFASQATWRDATRRDATRRDVSARARSNIREAAAALIPSCFITAGRRKL